jgi:hypothetical protein
MIYIYLGVIGFFLTSGLTALTIFKTTTHNFKSRKKYVKAILYDDTHKISVHFAKPVQGVISIGEDSYMINDQDYFMDSKRYTTYSYRIGRVKPIPHQEQPLDPTELPLESLKSNELKTFKDAHVMKELLDATSRKLDMATLAVILLSVVLLGLMIMGISQNNQMKALLERIQQIEEYIKFIGGGINGG